jgi:hypothetical protein
MHPQKTQKLYLFLNVTMQVWRNCQALSEQTDDSSVFLNPTCFLKYVLKCEQISSYFDPDYPTFRLTAILIIEGSL